jgi:hypothetical protein
LKFILFETLHLGNQICNKSSHISRINDIEFTPYLSESSLIKGFGKDVGELFVGSHMGNLYVTLDGMISQEVVSDINVFGSRMLTRIVSNLDDTLIVT